MIVLDTNVLSELVRVADEDVLLVVVAAVCAACALAVARGLPGGGERTEREEPP